MDLVLFGIQGSGKGTHAKKLAADFGYAYFEAGGELRKEAASGSALGEKISSYIDVGNLVPHEIIMEMVRSWIGKIPMEREIIFDGVPRDLDQMRDFDAIMQELRRTFRCIRFLLDPEAGIERILGRAEREGRADDAKEEFIRRRMQIFREKTLPVIEEYEKKGLLTEVDAAGTIEEVYERFTRVLGIGGRA